MSNDLDEFGWDAKALRGLSDSIRSALRDERVPGADADKLSNFLEVAVKDEEKRYPTLDLETVEFARLDKLLNEILVFSESIQDMPLRFRVDVSNAQRLRRAWRRRFRERYFMMDQARCAVLISGGRLKDVSFNSALPYDLGKWQAERSASLSELEENLQFEPGQSVLVSLFGAMESFI